jgi:hypothetical protein
VPGLTGRQLFQAADERSLSARPAGWLRIMDAADLDTPAAPQELVHVF